jgi:hypothetical protein
VLPKYFKHSNYSSFVRQVLFGLDSLICIIFTKYEKIVTRATSTINTSTSITKMLWVRLRGKLRKKRKRITNRTKKTVNQSQPPRSKKHIKLLNLISLKLKSPSNVIKRGLTVTKKYNLKKIRKDLSNRRETVLL